MTRRRDVLKTIQQAAKEAGIDWELDHEGGNHTVYKLGGLMVPIPRHNEIDNRMAVIIFKECAEKLGRDWWK